MSPRRRDNLRRVAGPLAWSGLMLMFASFVWLQMISSREERRPRVRPSSSIREPFTFVIIDPGHGGQDSGAIAGVVLEKNLTLDVAQRLKRLLHNQGLGTLLTRDGDEYVSLRERARAANRQRDSIFISIHFDYAQTAATGVETYYAGDQVVPRTLLASWLPFLQRTPSESTILESQSLAVFVEDALAVRTQAVKRGTRAEQFYVIANVRHPAILVEGGFLTNKDDIAKLTKPEYRQQLAVAISDGINRYRAVLRERQPTIVAGAPET